MPHTSLRSWRSVALVRLGIAGGSAIVFTMILALLAFTEATISFVFIVAHAVSGAFGYLLTSPRPLFIRGLSAVVAALVLILPLEIVGALLLERWLSTGGSSDILPGLAGLACVAFGVFLMAPASVAFAGWWDAKNGTGDEL